MRKKLFITAILVILATPAFLLGRWAYENRQVVGRAEDLFKQLPKYPGATFIEKYHSLTSLGYGERYKVSENRQKIYDFYKTKVPPPWKLLSGGGSFDTQELAFQNQDLRLNVSITTDKGSIEGSSPPYGLFIDISQVP